jgi:hypothetical protein
MWKRHRRPRDILQQSSDGGRQCRVPRAVAASLSVVAGLSFISFVALYRAPLPNDAFTALGTQLAAAADTRPAR